MKVIKLLIPLLALWLMSSCKKQETPAPTTTPINQASRGKTTGFVQKGPYLNGSTITLTELNDTYTPTGLMFNSEILNHTGAFNIKHIPLASSYVELKGQGFYFNEISGGVSSAQLTLSALANIDNATDINVNVLSTLEKRRVEYLIDQGTSFDNAKKQAQLEVLKVFGFDNSETLSSETLNITNNTEGDAILLAISVILQSYRSVGELSELIANMSDDLYKDGKLDSESLGSQLINGSQYLNLAQIKANIENRYKDLGQNINVPNFEKYVQQFVNNTTYKITESITYPIRGDHGSNLLSPDVTTVSSGKYSIKVVLPKSVGFKVKVAGSDANTWAFSADIAQNNGWTYTQFDTQGFHRFFTATKDGELDMYISVRPGTLSLEIYEGNQNTPTSTKVITIN
ncbi:hypothetical protein [uncultured Microscilla sp.]|uniref:hypothetical protein n=1 Tax=uncultured Microscilla sp. TaxID=432653 RepID=UPI00260F2DA0|nr:hypothetical protein [uncultured Microscilla sp.]